MIFVQPFTKEVIYILKSIPYGTVVTYGQIAKMAGSPRSARQVVRILHVYSEIHSIPWHRVVNVRGEIAISNAEHAMTQRKLLVQEGVPFLQDGRVDLLKFKQGGDSS